VNHVHRPMARGHCGSGPKEIPTVDGENNVVAHRLHSQHTDVVLEQHGQNLFFETVEVRIHYVERHLNGIEREAVLGRGGQYFQMYDRAPVAGEADEANLTSLLRIQAFMRYLLSSGSLLEEPTRLLVR